MTDTDPTRWRPSPRPASTAPVTVLLAVLIAAALTGCGSSGHGDTASSAHGRTMTVVAQRPRAASTQAVAATPAHRTAASAPPTVVATVKRAVALRSAPGRAGHVLGTITTHTGFGSVTAVPVVKRRGAWLGVISLLAGNRRLGWIPASATSLTGVRWRIYVSLDRQRITVLYDRHVVKRFETSTGVVGAGTPTGHFAVTDRLLTGVQYGPYGCCILALSAIQPRHLSDWDGGDRIAIHATDDTAELGQPASHGCVHVSDADGRWLLSHIPDGTLVVIADARFHPARGSPA